MSIGICLLKLTDQNLLSMFQNECRLFVRDRNAEIGALRYTEISQVLAKSRKVIIVLSNSYLENNQCRGDADLAGLQCFCELASLYEFSL